MRFATASLVKAPPQVLVEWAAYHLNSGIDEMHIFFDDPQDPAIALLEPHPSITCYRCDAQFWRDLVEPMKREVPDVVPEKQHIMLRYLLGRTDLNIDWLAHIDSDELIWAPGDLRTALHQQCREGLDHVQMLPLEAVPPRPQMQDPFREVTVFKEHKPKEYVEARERGVTAPFRTGKLFRGHRRGKALVRFGAIKTMRVHGPTLGTLASGRIASETADDLWILHYDAGSFDEWFTKWQNFAVYGDHVGPMRIRQSQRFAAAAALPKRRERMKALRQLYRREYMLRPQDEKILRELGLVRTVALDPDLFTLRPAAS